MTELRRYNSTFRAKPSRWKPKGKYGFKGKSKPTGAVKRSNGRLKPKVDRKLLAWGKKVRERDENRCQWPGGCFTGDTRIDPHHIAERSLRPDLKYDVDNGVALCRTHHDWLPLNREAAIAIGLLSDETYEAAMKEARVA